MPYIPNPIKKLESDIKNLFSTNLIRLVIVDKNGSESYLTDRAGNSNLVLSKSASLLDPSSNGKSRIITLNASDEYYDFNDSDDLSFGGTGTDSAFTIIWCGKPINLETLFGKFSAITGNVKTEYLFMFAGTNSLQLNCYNSNSTSVRIGRRYSTNLAGDTATFHCYIGSYSGSRVGTGISIYRDGIKIDNTNNDNGAYTGMSNTATKAGGYQIASSGVKTGIEQAQLSSLIILNKEISQTEVTLIDNLLRKYVGVL